MKKMLQLLVCVLLCAPAAYPQGVTATRVRGGSSLPSLCVSTSAVVDVFIKTAAPNKGIYYGDGSPCSWQGPVTATIGGVSSFNTRTGAVTLSQADVIAAVGFTPENVANKDTDGTLVANSDTKYSSQKAVKTYTDTALNLKANNASPALTGTPSAPSFALNGTGGLGFLEVANQSSPPSTPTSAGRFYFDSSNRFSWKGTNGFTRTFDGTANTADRIYILPDAPGAVVLDTATQTLTNKTLTAPKVNQINDANGNASVIHTATASAVNQLTIANAVTGNKPSISATGTDANIGLTIQSKGTTGVTITGSGSGITHNIVARDATYAFGDGATNGFLITNSSFTNVFSWSNIKLGSSAVLGWSSITNAPGAAADIGLSRNSAGMLEVNNGTAGTFRDLKLRSLSIDATMTASGTTGNQTINKALFSVNFAASASSLVVTNSLISATSGIVCTVNTNDATLKSVQAVPSAGSVTLFGNAAATGETRVTCNVW